VVRNGIAPVDVVVGDELAEALSAVPGTVLSVGRMAWAVRIGPERAFSVAQIADRFGLVADENSRVALGDLVATRDVSRPLVELIDRGRVV
jgi:hypothetical protein